MFRLRLTSLAVLGLAACSSTPPAPPPPASYTVSWTAPPNYTDGFPIVGPLTYNVYAGACGSEKLAGSTSSLSLRLPAGLVGCAYVTASQSGHEGPPSAKVNL